MKKNRPRFIIAAAASGSGKTTVTMGLIRWFIARGVRVYPFKVGPDYIDPGFHALCAERPCYNLDTLLMGEKGVRHCLAVHSGPGGVAVIEGVMGLYDGKSGPPPSGSTAEVARVTGTPVIVLIDARAAAQTIGAVALGIKQYDPSCPVAGFILNRIGSHKHYDIVKRAVETATGLPVAGWLPKMPGIKVPERHLGLVAAWENSEKDGPANPITIADTIGARMNDSFDFNMLNNIAHNAPPLEIPGGTPATQTRSKCIKDKIRIGIAMDNAFHFYYRENLDILESLGAELVSFSPVSDPGLPPDIHGIYLGGGYPENHLPVLAANTGMKESLRLASENRMPVYAECGGLMYLARSITSDNTSYAMAGVFDVPIEMGGKLSALGYYTGMTSVNSMIGPVGTRVRGHMFRWSYPGEDNTVLPHLYKLEKDGDALYDGYVVNNTIGSYLHVHFTGSPSIAHNFITRCRAYKKGVL